MFNHYNILEQFLCSFMYVEQTQFNSVFLNLNYYTQKVDLLNYSLQLYLDMLIHRTTCLQNCLIPKLCPK